MLYTCKSVIIGRISSQFIAAEMLIAEGDSCARSANVGNPICSPEQEEVGGTEPLGHNAQEAKEGRCQAR